MNRKFGGNSRQGRGKFLHNSKKKFTKSDKPHFQKQTRYDTRDRSVSYSIQRLKEEDVGITEYISKHSGFNGIIKQRYADFHVNEIDCDGNIATLTNLTPPEIKAKHLDEKDQLEEHLKSSVSPEVFESIKDLVNQTEDNKSEVQIEVTEMSKDDRRKLHSAIKTVGSEQLVSNTKEKEGKKFIVICKHNSKVRQQRQMRWPVEYGGDYVHFVLHKQNLDTMETVNFLASRLRIKPNMITYAGTKDRRGITSQFMSIYHVEPKTLATLNSSLRGFSLGNYCLKTKGLKLGDLQGNRFRIVLRNVTGSDEEIEQAMKSLSSVGFLNYYGLQRFGSSVAVPTHAIGKALLQGDWKLAIELILKPREDLNDGLAKAREIWWETRDALRALKVLPNREKFIEGKLLLGLSLCKPNDYINALEKIPRNTRLLYLHSYQSLVWNKVVSRRAKELGLKPIVGDLIFLNGAQTDDIADVTLDEVDDEESESPVSETVDNPMKKNPVKIVTENDLSNVHIHDIVMPLPGHDVVYPENILKDWYEEILKSDGLSSAGLKQTVRKYSVSGAYRKMTIRPDSLSWKTVHYSDPYKPLELSDRDKMKNVEPPRDEPDGTYKALNLDFCLPSSTYATMALREILKLDTSCQHQASLNNYHIQKENEHLSTVSTDGDIKHTTESKVAEVIESSDSHHSGLPGKNSEDQTEELSKDDEQSNIKDVSSKILDAEEEKKDKSEERYQKIGELAQKREMEDVVSDVEEKKIKLETD